MRRPAIIATAMLLVLAGSACGDDDTGGSTQPPATTEAPTTTHAPTTTQEPTTTQAPTTIAVAENPALCDAFLAFRGAQDFDGMVEALNVVSNELGAEVPIDVQTALDGFLEGNFGEMTIGEAIGAMRDHVIPLCRVRYYATVTGATDDTEAGQRFFDAVVAGDKDAAASLAHSEIVAQFEPWAGYGGSPGMEEAAGGFTMQLDPETRFTCEVADGIVERCRFG